MKRPRSASQPAHNWDNEEPLPKRRRQAHTPNRVHPRRSASPSQIPNENRPPWLPSGPSKGNPDAWLYSQNRTPNQAPRGRSQSQSQPPIDDRPPWLPPGAPKGDWDSWLWDSTLTPDGTPRSARQSGSRSRSRGHMLRSPPLPRTINTPLSLKSSVPRTAALRTPQIPVQSPTQAEALGLALHESPSTARELEFEPEDAAEAPSLSPHTSGTAAWPEDMGLMQQPTSDPICPGHTDINPKPQPRPPPMRPLDGDASSRCRRQESDQKQTMHMQSAPEPQQTDTYLTENCAKETPILVPGSLKLRRFIYWMTLWSVLLLGISWAICMLVRPQHMFCDVEIGGSSRFHNDCEPCPEGGFCAQGQLWECRDTSNTATACVEDSGVYYYDVLHRHLGFWSVRVIFGGCAVWLGLAFVCSEEFCWGGSRPW